MERVRTPLFVCVGQVLVEDSEVEEGLVGFRNVSGSVEEEIEDGFGAPTRQIRGIRAEFREYREESRGFAEWVDKRFQVMGESLDAASERIARQAEAFECEQEEGRKQMWSRKTG